MFDQLTVAEAAALINVGIIFLTLSFPLLVSLVTVGTSKKSINAATWSVLGRLLNQSLWPSILCTDTANTTKVDKGVIRLSYLSTLAALILALAAAITPLGLSEVQLLKRPEDTQFFYARDLSPIGLATQSRDNYTFSRICGDWTSCPGNHDPFWTVQNGSHPYLHTGPQFRNGTPEGSISTAIASNITSVFTSATNHFPSTVAGAFDIEYRSFVNYNNDSYIFANSTLTGWRDHGEPRTQGDFRFVQEFIADAKIQAIEGLLVSTTDRPGIGFRNHTLPPSSHIGYAWKEHILWLEPETSCTNLNVSLDYIIPIPGYGVRMKAWLVDRGGFLSLPAVSGTSWFSPDNFEENMQDDPELLGRSHKAATATNFVIMGFLNQTAKDWSRSHIGTAYDIAQFVDLASPDDIDPRQVSMSVFGSATPALRDSGDTSWEPGLPGILQYMYFASEDKWDADGILSINDVLSWTDEIAEIHRAGLSGGILMGAGVPLDEEDVPMEDSPNLTADVGERWSRPLYSCISTVKASVKTVEFVLNGTASLSNLFVKSVKSSDGSVPTWAVERLHASSDEYNYDPGSQPTKTGNPFWGVVSPDLAGHPGISTLQRKELYLPVGSVDVFGGYTLTADDGAASANAPLQLMDVLYSSYSNNGEVLKLLSGQGNQALLEKWTQLSADAYSAGNIIDLMWTDLAANALIGTKSALSRPDGEQDATNVNLPAREYKIALAFDWRYAAVVLVFCGMYVVIVCWSLILLCTRRVTLAALAFMLNQTAAGRSVTTERHLGRDETQFAKTSDWAHSHGDELVQYNGLSSVEHKEATMSSEAEVESEDEAASLR